MLVTTKWMAEKYAYFNNKYWNGQLPGISFSISNSRKTWGFATYRYILDDSRRKIKDVEPLSITLSNYYDSPEEIKETTLLHEMIHIADYFFHPEHFINLRRTGRDKKYDAHGPVFFMKEAQRLAADGWEIQKYVTMEARSVSTLSDENEKKLEKRASTGYIVCIADDKSGMKSGKWVMRIDKSKMPYFDDLFNGYYKSWMESNFANAKWYEAYCIEFADKRKSSTKPIFTYYKEDTIESAMNSGKIKYLEDVIKSNGVKEQNKSIIPEEDIPHIWNYIFGRLLKDKDWAIEALVKSNNYYSVKADEPTLKKPLMLTTDRTKAGIYKDYVIFAVNASTVEKALTTYKKLYFTKLKNEIYDQAPTLQKK